MANNLKMEKFYVSSPRTLLKIKGDASTLKVLMKAFDSQNTTAYICQQVKLGHFLTLLSNT